MTPERAKELLPIITAYANGETIQLSHVDSDLWHTYPAYDFNAKNAKYRIKPKVPEYRLFKWIAGPVGVYTRNHFGCSSADLIHFVDISNGGKWLTDWLPIPNYNE